MWVGFLFNWPEDAESSVRDGAAGRKTEVR